MAPSNRSDGLRLRWTAPAAHWTEAAPIGNGALGGMVFGDRTGRVALNDSSVWSGTPDGPARALESVIAKGAGPARLAEARAAVAAGDDDTVERLLRTFEGPWSQEFLPLGDLEVDLGAVDAQEYERVLDLDRAVAEESFTRDGARIRRRTWASAPDGVLVVDVAADAPLAARIRLRSPLRLLDAAAGATAAGSGAIDVLVQAPVDGAPSHHPNAPAHVWANDASEGFDPAAAVALAVRTDGEVTARDADLRIAGARRITVVLATETSARRWWNRLPALARPELAALARERATRAADEGPDVLAARHEQDATRLLGRARLHLGDASRGAVDVADLLASGDDRRMAEVLFAFGRYVLVSSSRPGSPPANLQGIWNDSMRPPWSSNYTININTEMNYWLAERTGLGELHEPLLDLIDRVAESGAAVARALYGARGWVAHHNTDPWGYALPVGAGEGATSWAFWPMGGLWLADHLWQRWEYGRDRAQLAERILPLLRGASAFALDWLVEDGRGDLGTSPATSPENSFRRADGSVGSVSTSTGMDLTLIRATLERTLAAGTAAGTEGDPLLEEIRAALPRIPLPRVVPAGGTAPAGQVAEWGADVVATDAHHRHVSHLVGLYPLTTIDVERTPELAEAARATLDARGGGAMGWSWAWKIALRARLGDGEAARDLFREAIRPYTDDPDVDGPVDGSAWGGLLPNLFSTHPPFQLDGNFGFTAAIAEMLVGSGRGTADDPIRLLPALPTAWPSGEIRGVHTRGGVAIDLAWRDGRPTAVTAHDATGAAPARVTVSNCGERHEVTVGAGAVTLPASAATR
ncbi:glycosyl hydrolase family 95 catalytic domain-containing protein [Microbacterium sp. JZ31]|uniref:glycosyl hydrolase family 95 catalytic domain-containing protein n=1 Tax=Microbacterium sp. JZ31 TaxID=1906274 RepID=UPI001EE4ADE1|nr:glycoside hydrolase N-terminal domain-containing protein [Microbacterium sp. JZ31]